MRRYETLAALLAVVLASAGALPIRGRLVYALAAILILITLVWLRLRSALLARTHIAPKRNDYARAQTIRQSRKRRP